jgi:hypothetical protein
MVGSRTAVVQRGQGVCYLHYVRALATCIEPDGQGQDQDRAAFFIFDFSDTMIDYFLRTRVSIDPERKHR